MKKLFWTQLRIIAGIICILIGIAGLFLPFVQGIILILIGLGLLGYGPVRKWIKKKN
ncbi:MAG: hypothetical protein QW165_00435 [Candidatus Woesearchaeota archaeon]